LFGFLHSAGAGQISKGPAQVRSFVEVVEVAALPPPLPPPPPLLFLLPLLLAAGVVVVPGAAAPAPTPTGYAGPVPKVSRERRACAVGGDAVAVLVVLEKKWGEKMVRQGRKKRF
jgi:hypothetical protein